MKRATIVAVKCALLIALLVLTNYGLGTRLSVILEGRKYVVLAVLAVIWGLSVLAVLAAAFHPRWPVRLAWAIPIALSSAFAYGYFAAQGAEFFVFDLMNFWTSRHEMGRASEFFAGAFHAAIALFFLGVVAIAMRPALPRRIPAAIQAAMAVLPVLPVALIAAIVVHKSGAGSEGMPKQFSPLSLAAIAAYKLQGGALGEREKVAIAPAAPLSRAIVMLVDESVRSDFVSLQPGNPFTPKLADLRDRWVDFGPSVSSSNCSAFSNALLRFMVDRRNLVHSVHTSPTVWQYAKAAGYRTVFIDGQAGEFRGAGRLQNYMTPSELSTIDNFYQIGSEVPPHSRDDEVMKIVLAEIAVGDKVFVYADKNGAHFPYSMGSPQPESAPKVAAPAGSELAIKQYGDAIRWSTDRTLAQLTNEGDWQGTTVIYTSDHGQNLEPGHLTHCSTYTNIDDREAMVPLLVASGDAGLQQRFAAVAGQHFGNGTHFAIAPALLELMGYRPADIAARYEGSLLTDLSWQPQFVTDDILGLFSDQPAWHTVDPVLMARK